MPVHLLVYAVQTAVTTATCIADYLSWSEFQSAQKIELGKLYVPYLALCMFCSLCIPRPLRVSELTFIAAVFMAVDMLGRLNEAVGQRQVVRGKKAQ